MESLSRSTKNGNPESYPHHLATAAGSRRLISTRARAVCDPGDRADHPKEILIRGRGPAAAEIRVETNQGNFDFQLQDLAAGTVLDFLDAKVQVSGLHGAQKITNDSQDDGFPSISMEDDQHGWMVWQSFPGESDEVRLSRD